MSVFNKDEWLRIRGQGKLIYILLYWVLFAAVPATLISAVIKGITKGNGMRYFISTGFVQSLVMTFVLCAVVSIVCGIRKWNKNEKLFKRG